MRTKSRPVVEKAPANLDEVKRRFIRQNRELAKNNSSQSLRIRNLELEVSKLLSDNLDLREQVLSLQNEVENARRQASGDAIRQMKQDLRTKIAELSGLVDGMDEDTQEERMVPDKERILSPSRQQYRERQPLAELLQDAVMPTISEDKQFPRRTLNADEIRAIRLSDQSGTTGSPDLGPPPVVHFDVEDPIKFNQEKEEAAQEASVTSPKPEDEELLPSVNLETRRRRRDSKIEIRRHSILAQSPVKDGENGTTMLRTGAKRKLSDRETEKPIKPPSQGDFTFSRKASADQSSDEKPEAEEAPGAGIDESAEPVLAPTKPTRKILGEKSVNMSPRKSTVRAGKPLKEEPIKPEKPVAPPKAATTKERPPPRGRRTSSIPMPAPQDEPAATFDDPPPEMSTEEQLHHTKTPAPPATDLFSPITSEPSARAAEARDTPPPSELSSISNTTEGGQRPSRRSRSAVSYAEPSLIAKMRRPDGKKVDAISGLKNRQHPLNPSAERRSMSGSTRTSLNGSGSITIKREPVDDDSAWKGAPRPVEEGSPLREKSTDQHPPAAETVGDTISTSRPSSSATLSSVIASSRKRREQFDKREDSPPGFPSEAPPADSTAAATTTASDPSPSAIAKKMEELDLYDFKDSSSPASTNSATGTADGAAEKKKASHRRHSSVPKREKEADAAFVGSAGPATATTARPERSSRRRSMMV